MSKKETTNRLTRLRNSTQGFNFTVELVQGSMDKFTDFSNRFHGVELNESIFPRMKETPLNKYTNSAGILEPKVFDNCKKRI